ncbi:MAG: flagellar export chaperone FliS [Firmicutes bacterium]|nr:flagellar export chaperone FliS [Bacillota bacterium]
MLTGNNPYERYRQTQIQTAGQLDLIIMMYDGAIRFINQAKKALADKEFIPANKAMQRAQDIIDELNISLNPEAGEIATNLRNLYVFINQRLIQANVKKDEKILDEVLQLLTTLRSSWTGLQASRKPAAVQK